MPAAVATPSTDTRDVWYYYLGRSDGPSDPSKPVYEYVRGVRVEKAMGAYESFLANRLNRRLIPYLDRHGLGTSLVGMEIELTPVGTRRIPDLLFLAPDTWPVDQPPPGDAWWAVVPDLAVESVSPGEQTHATFAKVHEYFAAGVKAVWLILPNVEQVLCFSSPAEVRILTADDELTGDPVIPGFRMAVADLFPPAEEEPA